MESVIENMDDISVDFSEYKVSHEIQLENVFEKHERSSLLILNQRLSLDNTFFKNIWDNSFIHVCADGGANRLYDFFNSEEERHCYLPEYIVGDLDSLRDEVRKYYHSVGVKIIMQRTQYANDFSKCTGVIALHFNSPKFIDLLKHQDTYIDIDIQGLLEECLAKNDITASIHLLALGAIGGRFDQTMQSITELYRLERSRLYSKTYFITETGIIFTVPTGGTAVYYSPNFKESVLGDCGLIPFDGPTTIHITAGLKWDVANWTCGICEGKITSSNRIVGNRGIYVDTEKGLVMSIELEWTALIGHFQLEQIRE